MRSYDARWARRWTGAYRSGSYTSDSIRTYWPSGTRRLTTEKKRLFEGAMPSANGRLEKGLTRCAHHPVGVSNRHTSGWIDRAKEPDETLDESLRERAFIAKLPYTERELQTALEDLRKP